MGAASDYLNGGAAPAVPKRKGAAAAYLAGGPAPGAPPPQAQGIAGPVPDAQGHVFGGSQQGDSRSVLGIASPAGRRQAQGIEASAQNFAIGAGAGILKTAKGAQQLISTAASHLPIPGAEEAGKRAEQRSIERHEIDADIHPLLKESTAANVGQFVGEAAPMAVIPGGITGGFLKRAVTSAAAGGIQGAIMDADNPGTGAATGAVLGGAASGIMSGLGKVANAAMDRVPENLTKTLADKWGIRTTLAEQTTGAASKLDAKVESLPGPFGTRGFREAQQAESHAAAKSYLGRYIADPAAGDIEAGNRAFVGSLYDHVKDLVGEVPNQEIPTAGIANAGKDLLGKYPDIFKRLQDTKTEALINDIVSGVKPVQTPASAILGADGLPAVAASTVPKTLTFDEAWTLRQGLGEKIGQLRKLETRGEVDRTAVSQMSKLYGAVSDTLDRWTGDIGKPEIKEAFKAANGAYKDNVVRYRVIQDAYDQALSVKGDQTHISPQKFSTALKKIIAKNKYEKVFTPDQVAEMSGLMNIMQTVKRAGQFMEDPPTGNRWALSAVGTAVEGAAYNAAGVAGAVKTAGLAGAAALTTKWLTTTPTGKRLALAASKVNPESKAMARILDQVYKMVPKFAAGAGVSDTGGPMR
jgi:hypothetical protein